MLQLVARVVYQTDALCTAMAIHSPATRTIRWTICCDGITVIRLKEQQTTYPLLHFLVATIRHKSQKRGLK